MPAPKYGNAQQSIEAHTADDGSDDHEFLDGNGLKREPGIDGCFQEKVAGPNKREKEEVSSELGGHLHCFPTAFGELLNQWLLTIGTHDKKDPGDDVAEAGFVLEEKRMRQININAAEDQCRGCGKNKKRRERFSAHPLETNLNH